MKKDKKKILHENPSDYKSTDQESINWHSWILRNNLELFEQEERTIALDEHKNLKHITSKHSCYVISFEAPEIKQIYSDYLDSIKEFEQLDIVQKVIFYCKSKCSDLQNDSDLVALAKMRAYATMVSKCREYLNNKSFVDFVDMCNMHYDDLFFFEYLETIEAGEECEDEIKQLHTENEKLINFINQITER